MTPNPPASGPAGGAPQQAPFGVSPASGPTPNKGYEAAAMQKLGVLLTQLPDLLKLVGPSSEMGQVLLDFMKRAGKFVPAGAVNPAAEQRSIQQMMAKSVQNNSQMQALKQGGQAPGAPPAQPAPPMPAAQAAA